MVSLEVLIVIGIVLLLLLSYDPDSPTASGERPEGTRGDGRTTDGRLPGEGSDRGSGQ